jgi:hypothetical protein
MAVLRNRRPPRVHPDCTDPLLNIQTTDDSCCYDTRSSLKKYTRKVVAHFLKSVRAQEN